MIIVEVVHERFHHHKRINHQDIHSRTHRKSAFLVNLTFISFVFDSLAKQMLTETKKWSNGSTFLVPPVNFTHKTANKISQSIDLAKSKELTRRLNNKLPVA